MSDIYDIIIDDPLLRNAFRFVVLNNKSNLAPYHGFNHMMLVTQKIYDGIQIMEEWGRFMDRVSKYDILFREL